MNIPETTVTALSLNDYDYQKQLPHGGEKKKDFPYKTKHNYPVSCFPK